MPRDDLSDFLIHFTKGHDADGAFRNLLRIMSERVLNGGVGEIRGGFSCVCFTEAPLRNMVQGFINPQGFTTHSRYGVMLTKEQIFELGGRPVIYGSHNEFEELGSHQWRHVRYDPCGDPVIDFTWQREWRLRYAALPIDPTTARIIVPDRAAAERLQQEHATEQDIQVQMYSQIMDPMLAEQHRERWQWGVVILSE